MHISMKAEGAFPHGGKGTHVWFGVVITKSLMLAATFPSNGPRDAVENEDID